MNFLNQINFEVLGSPTDKVPIVFLHGLMGYGLNWKKIAKAFQNDRQVLIYDQRGHGKSFKPETGYQPEDYADDLIQIIDEIGWEKIDLIGHSMGGRNALNFTHRSPERVRRFIIEDIGPEVSQDSLERIQNLINLVPVPFENKQSAKEFFLVKYPALISKNSQAHVLAQYFYANMIEAENGTVDWRFSLNAILSSLKEGRIRTRWDEWDELKVPTFVIRGEHSEDLSSEIFIEMLQRNRLSRGFEVKGSGHWVHFEKSDLFIQLVRRFLDTDIDEIFRQDFDFQERSS